MNLLILLLTAQLIVIAFYTFDIYTNGVKKNTKIFWVVIHIICVGININSLTYREMKKEMKELKSDLKTLKEMKELKSDLKTLQEFNKPNKL